MIFNEIYGCYYNAVAKMPSFAVNGELTEKKMNEIVSDYAFEESMLTIIPALKNQEWQLLDGDYGTPIVNKPTMPITSLEKRWLKTILLDPRIALFKIDTKGLGDVEPLFTPKDIVYFDRYSDGDRYGDPAYISKFNIIVQAIRKHKKVKLKYLNGENQKRSQVLEPVKIEYSDKEDKFRVLCAAGRDIRTINMGRILQVVRLDEKFSKSVRLQSRKKETLIFELTDERNALERVLMKFAHYKKEVERLGENFYRVEMEYDVDDETDVLIQILSFGGFVRIIAPVQLRDKLCERVKKQMNMMNW